MTRNRQGGDAVSTQMAYEARRLAYAVLAYVVVRHIGEELWAWFRGLLSA